MSRFCQGTKQSQNEKTMSYLRIATAPFALALLLAGVKATIANEKSISLTPIGTYASGIFDAGGAEIVAHDARTQRLFVVNAQAATVDVLSIRDPSQPEKIGPLERWPTAWQFTRG